MWFTIHLDRKIHNKNFRHESEQQQNVGIGFAKVCFHEYETKERSEKKEKAPPSLPRCAQLPR